MVKYAILKVKGKQYKVSEGDNVLVDRLNGGVDERVLLFKDDDKVLIGKPYLQNVKVNVRIDKHIKGKKIDVFKYKAKSRYRKHLGFRAELTSIFIEKITS